MVKRQEYYEPSHGGYLSSAFRLPPLDPGVLEIMDEAPALVGILLVGDRRGGRMVACRRGLSSSVCVDDVGAFGVVLVGIGMG